MQSWHQVRGYAGWGQGHSQKTWPWAWIYHKAQNLEQIPAIGVKCRKWGVTNERCKVTRSAGLRLPQNRRSQLKLHVLFKSRFVTGFSRAWVGVRSGKPHEGTKRWRTFPHRHADAGHRVPVANFTPEETPLIWTAVSSTDVTSAPLVWAGWTSAFADVRARKHSFHSSHDTLVCWTGRSLCSAEHIYRLSCG